MILPEKTLNSLPRAAAAVIAVAALLSPCTISPALSAQTAPAHIELPAAEPSAIALPLPEDRGQAALTQTLKRLGTTASVLYIVAHPDDEDGALLTYLSRGLGARVTLFTLTRGEGGQNAINAEVEDELGLIRTSELLKADEYYGVQQLWGTEADFGFSKTQKESFDRWGRDRVLYDAVLAVRLTRPQIIVATFVGGVSDGHGQHQVSGEIAQEVFKAAADPKVFPEQLKNGIEPWQPLAMYSRSPFARVTTQGIFDYATGKWAPARFRNYITGEWLDAAPSADVTVPVGTWDSVLGRNYVQIAREGWGKQESQYGGANPTLAGPASSSFHLWAVAPQSAGPGSESDTSLFENHKVRIDTSLAGLASLAKGTPPSWLADGLRKIDEDLKTYESDCKNESGAEGAHKLAPIYRETLELYSKVKDSDLSAESKSDLAFELGGKVEQFQNALSEMLGLELTALTVNKANAPTGTMLGPGGGGEETARSVAPGEEIRVRLHATQGIAKAQLTRTWLESEDGAPWKSESLGGELKPDALVNDQLFRVTAAADATPTAPFFTRPTIEQPYYDTANQDWRLRSFEPWPLSGWAEFAFDGLPIRIGQVVQTMRRVNGPGGILEPLVVTPAIGVRIQPQAKILPLDGSALRISVTVHAEMGAEGTVTLKLPDGWHAEPSERQFALRSGGDTEPLAFEVNPDGAKAGVYNIKAIARVAGKDYSTGWRSVGYLGLRPYNEYMPAELKTRKVDVKLAPGLRVGYIMGSGDPVPQAISEMGVEPHILNEAEVASGDYSAFNVLVIGIRAYSTRPELAGLQPRLQQFVERGGTLIVQYQSATFPAPLPLSVGARPETVVDETSRVTLLNTDNSLLNFPNKITTADFDGWVEERGHSFLESFDPGYTALTETADEGQDPQRGGLIVTHPGKGTYIYVAYALYRQLPELVPGSYRLLANMLSAGQVSANK